MRILADPSPAQWNLAPRASPSRESLALLVRHAPAFDPVQPVIATGHQAWLWHPGILAKDLAMVGQARRRGVGCFHLVVDHDVHPALTLDLPVVEGRDARVVSVRLGNEMADVPAGCQPGVDPQAMLDALDHVRRQWPSQLTERIEPLAQAIVETGKADTLAQQITRMILALMHPLVGEVPVVYSTELRSLPVFGELVDHMLGDARRCAAIYNQAVAELPRAGIAPLAVEPDRVELPLWALRWGEPRRRVYADLADSSPLLAFEDGAPLDPRIHPLAPKALFQTALLREACCDLFIHGKGGGIYDQVMERWWTRWTGRELAPLAVVSADLFLDLPVPQAQIAEQVHAVWWRHHLPHNLDRAVPAELLDAARVQEKRELLAHMDDDRDKRRRARAFARIHEINALFAQRHPQALAAAEDRLRQVIAGVANAGIAQRRDWCFALYPGDRLQRLAKALGA